MPKSKCAPLAGLPSYNDDEVTHFHPIAELSLHLAIKMLGEHENLEITHHHAVGALTADFVVRRAATGKCILVVEIKRRPSQVVSTVYRNQTRNYVIDAGDGVESPYYALSNLEVTDAFKYSPDRPTANLQLLIGSPYAAGDLAVTEPKAFVLSLAGIYRTIIDQALNDSGRYEELPGSLHQLIRHRVADPPAWHALFMTTGYECIRGAMSIRNWRSAVTYARNPRRLATTGSTLNFDAVFRAPFPSSDDEALWNVSMLNAVRERATIRRSAEDLAQLAFEVIADGRSQEGLIPTDQELAILLAVLLRWKLGRSVLPAEIVWDPAAGTGNLILALQEAFPDVAPESIWANDNERAFAEPISLRIGLAHRTRLSPASSPRITSKSITAIDPNEAVGVVALVMNPPFQAGVRSVERRREFAGRIRALTGRRPRLLVGQLGIESLFLELVLAIVPNDTVCAVIFPVQFLTRVSADASALRHFLLTDFGLTGIVVYPHQGLFEAVTKKTVILLGRSGVAVDSVAVMDISTPLANLDTRRLQSALEGDGRVGEITDGVYVTEVERAELARAVNDGWQSLLPGAGEVGGWIRDNLLSLGCPIDDSYRSRRGSAGNQGGSSLIFIDSSLAIWSEIRERVPQDWLVPGLRTVDEADHPNISARSAPVRALFPPDTAFVPGTKANGLLVDIVDRYVALQPPSARQARVVMDRERAIRLLRGGKRAVVPANSVLIPRAIRRYARVFGTEDPTCISTNVVAFTTRSRTECRQLVSWLLTGFAQLQFEYIGIDQEGERKLEAAQIRALVTPTFSDISATQLANLENLGARAEFLDLFDPHPRAIDIAWAVTLWPQDHAEKTEQCFDLLRELVGRRRPN